MLNLRFSTGDVNLSGMSGEVATTEDNVPKGLVTWREAVGRAHTSAQLAMALYMLEASIAWDKSIMKAVSWVSSTSSKGSSVGITLDFALYSTSSSHSFIFFVHFMPFHLLPVLPRKDMDSLSRKNMIFTDFDEPRE